MGGSPGFPVSLGPGLLFFVARLSEAWSQKCAAKGYRGGQRGRREDRAHSLNGRLTAPFTAGADSNSQHVHMLGALDGVAGRPPLGAFGGRAPWKSGDQLRTAVRFPSPRVVDEHAECFIVNDVHGKALALQFAGLPPPHGSTDEHEHSERLRRRERAEERERHWRPESLFEREPL
jgi:hypothetical protein